MIDADGGGADLDTSIGGDADRAWFAEQRARIRQNQEAAAEEAPPAARTERPPRRRAVLHVGSEHLAALLRLPDDVDIVAFALDPLRDSIGFALESERFEPVGECMEPPILAAELAVDYDDDTVVQRVTWAGLDGAGFTRRTPRHQTVDDECIDPREPNGCPWEDHTHEEVTGMDD